MSVERLFLLCALLLPARLSADASDGRFQQEADGILDRVTGLRWAQPDVVRHSFADAQAHCASPWRLPALAELQTLIDWRSSEPLQLDAIFTTGQPSYWSATTLANAPTSAWSLFTGTATWSWQDTTTPTLWVLCVR